ncbi:dehydration-responsive element-binding protein 1F-like [Gastrolobium bilobum]|uniref:dehydration-responsive element-binding protein 1F-like n=1 Tax=Gastrolobium bilobum TaxID=150636 RepID=UPI002AB1280D|nr:dehydration-responsive element-binding protein 1F-like [Gastrolobium bilobum]
MDILRQSFDKSNSGYLSNPPITTHSDEEIIVLASARPKKRAGRRIFKETRHPVYRGVRRRNNNKWVCEVRVPNDKSTRIWLGTYPTPEMAARAHDVAALTLRGKSACLNFADSTWRFPLPASTDAEEIRRVAAEAAEACAVEDSYKQQSSVNAVTDCEVCSSDSVIENVNNKPLQGLYLDEVPSVAAFENLHDWFRSMADEPLRSPSPFVRYGRDWNDVDVDAEVSLWSFTI